MTSVLKGSLEEKQMASLLIQNTSPKLMEREHNLVTHLCHLFAFPVTQEDKHVKDLSSLLP